MTERDAPTLLLGTKEEGELQYIEGSLKNKKIAFETERHRQYLRVVPEPSASHDDIVRIAGETVSAFYKFGVLNELNKEYKSKDYELYALIGALMSVERDEERRRVKKAVKGEKEIALKSLVDYRLGALKEGWEGLKELALLLLKQCPSQEDVYALVPYFLNSESENGIEIVSDGAIKISSAAGVHVVPRLTSDPNANAVIEVVRSCPTNIIVKEKEGLDEGLLNAFRALGE